VTTAVMMSDAQAPLNRVHAATRSLQCSADETRRCINESLALLAAVDSGSITRELRSVFAADAEPFVALRSGRSGEDDLTASTARAEGASRAAVA
jgi:hypothetical protein